MGELQEIIKGMVKDIEDIQSDINLYDIDRIKEGDDAYLELEKAKHNLLLIKLKKVV